MLYVFDTIKKNDKLMNGVENKIGRVRELLLNTINELFSDNEKLRLKYVDLVNSILGDTYDIGSIITLLMKTVEEVSKLNKLDGVQKKILVKTIFEHILDYSPLTDVEKELSKYAFSGIVECIIFASKGGLKPVGDRCRLLGKVCCSSS